MRRDGGSYRDPSGYVFYREGRVYRAIMKRAQADYEAVRDTPLVRELLAGGDIIASRELNRDEARQLVPEAAYVVEHDPVPFVSYPYEWPFALLQRAARFHLDLHLRLLGAGVSLSDATAYNVQFLGLRPVFIDLLSLRPYEDGELWLGHHQFMQQFLHPLLLNALAGVSYNNWYKGNLDGIHRADLVRCLPVTRRLSRRVFKQVVLPNMIEREQREGDAAPAAAATPARLEKAALVALLRDLDSWIAGLRPGTISGTTWADYQKTRTYNADEVEEKRAAVAAFCGAHKPPVIWDIGCNTGEFSELALQSGCTRAIGFDLDEGALHLACERAQKNRLDLLPLNMDLLNPSTGCGWMGAERKALTDRAQPDAIIALALIHHLAIAGNVPLDEAVGWLVSLAPRGIIEFVHKSDETVQRMLRFRKDIFDDYDEAAFRRHLEAKAQVLERREVTASGRALYFYQRR
ncbi:MAG: class I SAM-dependent methyltransferase [Paracoccaceae bacterium]